MPRRPLPGNTLNRSLTDLQFVPPAEALSESADSMKSTSAAEVICDKRQQGSERGSRAVYRHLS